MQNWLFELFSSVWMIPIICLVILVVLIILRKAGKDSKMVKVVIILFLVYIWFMVAKYVILPSTGYIPNTPDWDNLELILYMIPFAVLLLRTFKNL